MDYSLIIIIIHHWVVSVIIAPELCIFSKRGPLLELHVNYMSIKIIFHLMKYPHLNNLIIVSSAFSNVYFLCNAN